MQLQAPVPPAALPAGPATARLAADPARVAQAMIVIGFAGLVAMAATLAFARGSLWLILAIHLAMLTSLSALVLRLRKRQNDITMAVLALIATAAMGPVGTFGTAVIAALSIGTRPSLSLLETWYERIALSIAVDPVTRICDNVSSGRTIDLRAEAPPSYEAVMAQGTTEHRQTVLGIIARRFHPDYLPVLSAALKSPEPVIRVQAAAVAAHLRPDIAAVFRHAIDAIEVASRAPATTLELLQRLRSLVDSGLLDESSRRQGLAVIERLGDVALSQISSDRDGRAGTKPVLESYGLGTTLERLLIERRRFADLRAHRSIRRSLTHRPHARIRRLPLSTRRQEARA